MTAPVPPAPSDFQEPLWRNDTIDALIIVDRSGFGDLASPPRHPVDRLVAELLRTLQGLMNVATHAVSTDEISYEEQIPTQIYAVVTNSAAWANWARSWGGNVVEVELAGGNEHLRVSARGESTLFEMDDLVQAAIFIGKEVQHRQESRGERTDQGATLPHSSPQPEPSMAQELVDILNRRAYALAYPEGHEVAEPGSPEAPAPWAVEGPEDLYKVLRTMLGTQGPADLPIQVRLVLPDGQHLVAEAQGNAALGGSFRLSFEDGTAWTLEQPEESHYEDDLSAVFTSLLQASEHGTLQGEPTANSPGTARPRRFVGPAELHQVATTLLAARYPSGIGRFRVDFGTSASFAIDARWVAGATNDLQLRFDDGSLFGLLDPVPGRSRPGAQGSSSQLWIPSGEGALEARDRSEASRLADHLGRWVEGLADDDPRLLEAEATRDALLRELRLPDPRRGMLRAILQAALDMFRAEVEELTASVADLLGEGHESARSIVPELPISEVPIGQPDPEGDEHWQALSDQLTDLAGSVAEELPSSEPAAPEAGGEAQPGRGTVIVTALKWAGKEGAAGVVRLGAAAGATAGGVWLATHGPNGVAKVLEHLLNLLGI